MELPRQGFLSAWRSITRQALWLIFHLTVYKKGASSIILDCNTQDIVLQQGYGTEQLVRACKVRFWWVPYLVSQEKVKTLPKTLSVSCKYIMGWKSAFCI